MSGSTTGPGDEEIDWSVPESPTELMELSRKLKLRSDAEIELLHNHLKFNAPVPAPILEASLSEIADELLTLTLSEADRLGSLLEEQGRGTELALTIADRQAKAKAAILKIQKRLTTLPDGSQPDEAWIANPVVVEKVELPWLERQTEQQYERVVEVSFAREYYDLGPDKTDVSDDEMRFVAMLTGLRKLDIQQSEVGNRGLAALRPLQHLEQLDARALNVTEAGWKSLVALTNLRQIKIRTPEGTTTNIGWAGNIPKLEILEAHQLNLTRSDLLELCRSRTLRELNLSGEIPDEELVLQRMPRLRDLSITLRGVPSRNSAKLSLLHLPNLEIVRTSVYRERENPTPAGLDKFELADLPRVNAVHIDTERFGSSGLLSLGRLPALQELSVSRTTIPGETFHWLEGLDRLTTLSCRTDAGDRALRAISNMKSLTYLGLGADEITDSGLAAVSNLTQLERLFLTGINSTNGLSACVSRLTNLKELTLSGAAHEIEFTDHPTLEWIRLNLMEADRIAVEGLPQLTRLEFGYGIYRELSIKNLPKLSGCGITSLEPERIESIHLANLPSLTHFSLGPIDRNGSIESPTQPFELGDEFLAQLIPMTRLKSLWLRKVHVTNEALMGFAQHPHLDSLDLSGPNLTSEGVKRLYEALKENRRKLREQRNAAAASKKK